MKVGLFGIRSIDDESVFRKLQVSLEHFFTPLLRDGNHLSVDKRYLDVAKFGNGR